METTFGFIRFLAGFAAKRRARTVLLAMLCGLPPQMALADAPAPAAVAASESGSQILLLSVEINGYRLQQVGEFIQRDAGLYAPRTALVDLGFQVPDTLLADPDGLVSLAAIPGLTWRLDASTQSLSITVDDALLAPKIVTLDPASRGSGDVESGTGAALEYDISGMTLPGRTLANGLFDLRVFSPSGVVSSGFLAATSPNRGAAPVIRLDTTYSFADVRTLRRYRVGDFISGGLPWTRPIRLGGLQVSLDFGVRPDLITFPLPSVSGSIAVPSTVDVLVNDTRVLSRELSPGPFSIPQLPVVTGAGQISTTVTDALGRQVVTSFNFYASDALLAPGLQSFSAQVGAIRRNWGLASSDYGAIVAIANYRRGLTSLLTAELAVEASRDVAVAGGGGVVNLGNIVLVNAALAVSYGRDPAADRQAGTRVSLGVQHRGAGRPLSLSASIGLADSNFRDVAAVNGDPAARREVNASAGLLLGRYGTLGLAYARQDRDPVRYTLADQPWTAGQPVESGLASPARIFRYPAQHAEIVTASYSVAIGGAAVYATAFQDLKRREGASFQIGVTIPLGARTSVSANGGAGSGRLHAQVQAARSADAIGEVGFQASIAAGDKSHQFGELQYKSPWALLAAGADHAGGQTLLRLSARGAVSIMQNTLFLSNSIHDSFAVVDTNGLAHVRVLAENRQVGITDGSGRLLVPDLRAFQINHLAIDPADIPSQYTLAGTRREVRPQDRSGVVVRFDVRPSHGALIHLVDETGEDMPAGSTATVSATGVAVPVGYEGLAYIEDLTDHNSLTVRRPDGRQCRLAFDYRPRSDDIPSIGPLQCQVTPGSP